jgi:hypothetical protein
MPRHACGMNTTTTPGFPSPHCMSVHSKETNCPAYRQGVGISINSGLTWAVPPVEGRVARGGQAGGVHWGWGQGAQLPEDLRAHPQSWPVFPAFSVSSRRRPCVEMKRSSMACGGTRVHAAGGRAAVGPGERSI